MLIRFTTPVIVSRIFGLPLDEVDVPNDEVDSEQDARGVLFKRPVGTVLVPWTHILFVRFDSIVKSAPPSLEIEHETHNGRRGRPRKSR